MKRTVPGLLLAAGWLLLLVYGSFLMFWAVVSVIGLLGAREFCRMTFAPVLYETDRVILAVVICLPIMTAMCAGGQHFSESLGVFLGFLGIVSFVFCNYNRFENSLQILYRAVLGLIYVGFLASYMVMIHVLPDGAHWLIILTAITAGSDTGAYLVGSRWGRHKLCPHISPKKTIEGAAGGIGGGMTAALLLSCFFKVEAGAMMIAGAALFLSLVGMVGDLLESVIKRGTNTKDSGTLLGGHGGVLDRVDSLLLTAPVLYYILRYADF